MGELPTQSGERDLQMRSVCAASPRREWDMQVVRSTLAGLAETDFHPEKQFFHALTGVGKFFIKNKKICGNASENVI